jgi:beta-mannosidase
VRSAEPLPPAPDAIHVDDHARQELDAGWSAASCAPDACATPAEAEAAGLDWIPATVPGTAAGALRDAGAWDFADGRDFDAEDWWFRTEFEAAPAAAGELVLLRLDGVATVHEAFLNGEPVGAGESMFAAAAIDVGGALREGPNELAIRCRALGPLLGARRKPRARWRTKLVDNRLRFHRTMLLGRCPGFAPGPAAVGPWRPVWIERRRTLAVAGIELRARCEREDGVLAVAATVRGMGGFEVSAADVVVSGAGEAEGALAVSAGADGAVELRGEVRVPGAPRWWPHTHGEPALHTVRLRVAGEEGEVGIDAGRVGFRELAAGAAPDHDVLEDGIDLHLNGIRVFARGAVWTPDDFVGMAPGRERLREALERVRAAGMNMVRIPGTGAYESRDFHDLCDELGILVWQDFMFANLDYPLADEDFRAAVEAEAAEVLAALAGRPSLAVVCGNSEVEQQAAMLGLDPEAGRGELFGDLLPGALERSGADAIYVPSAPCGGERPFVPGRGIANYFGVGGYRRPLSDARLAGVRFAAECLAFANVPDEAGVEAVLPGAPADVAVHHPRWKAGVPRDNGSGWDFDDVRDHYLRELFGVEPGELRRYDQARYLELSRAVSAAAMCAVFGEWRRAGSPCGGGLVLWLRDLVPGAGWGLVDQAGAPKRALHALAPLLAPTAVWITDEGLAGVAVHVANDGPEPLAGSLRVALYADGGRPVGEGRIDLDLDPHGGAEHDLETILGGFRDASWAYRFGPPAQDVVVAALEPREGGDGPTRRAFHLPLGPPLGQESAARLGLSGEGERRADGGARLRLRAERFVYSATLSLPGALHAAVEHLHLEPGADTVVDLGPESAGADKAFVAAVNMTDKLTIPLPDPAPSDADRPDA